MLDIICPKCNNVATLDSRYTIKNYVDVLDMLVESDGKLENIPRYVFYSCVECGNKIKLTIEQVLLEIRNKMARDAMYIRYGNNQKDLIKVADNIDPDSGLVYCGRCYGVDGEGNCFKDSYNNCKMRR